MATIPLEPAKVPEQGASALSKCMCDAALIFRVCTDTIARQQCADETHLLRLMYPVLTQPTESFLYIHSSYTLFSAALTGALCSFTAALNSSSLLAILTLYAHVLIMPSFGVSSAPCLGSSPALLSAGSCTAFITMKVTPCMKHTDTFTKAHADQLHGGCAGPHA